MKQLPHFQGVLGNTSTKSSWNAGHYFCCCFFWGRIFSLCFLSIQWFSLRIVMNIIFTDDLQIKEIHDLVVLLEGYVVLCLLHTCDITDNNCGQWQCIQIVSDVNKFCNTLLISLVAFPDFCFGRKGKTDHIFYSIGRKWRVTCTAVWSNQKCWAALRLGVRCISPGEGVGNGFPSSSKKKTSPE